MSTNEQIHLFLGIKTFIENYKNKKNVNQTYAQNVALELCRLIEEQSIINQHIKGKDEVITDEQYEVFKIEIVKEILKHCKNNDFLELSINAKNNIILKALTKSGISTIWIPSELKINICKGVGHSTKIKVA